MPPDQEAILGGLKVGSGIRRTVSAAAKDKAPGLEGLSPLNI